MRIVHIAVWTRDLETMRVFYERYFSGRSGEKYVNRAKGFESYMVRLGDTALELMRRPYISYELIAKVIGRGEGVTPAMAQRIETEIRYAGYIAREERLIRDIQRHENVKIPEDFDYSPIEMITLEAREKLQKIRPRTLAQAGRIPGVSPSDLAQLSIVLLKQK